MNPASIHAPDPRKVAAGISRARKAEVAEGRWRNPALGDKARRKLSRPRKHRGVLHQAIEKMQHGKMTDLTPGERRAYLRWRRKLRRARIADVRRYYRERYAAKQASLTLAEREAQREKRRAKKRRRGRKKNPNK